MCVCVCVCVCMYIGLGGWLWKVTSPTDPRIVKFRLNSRFAWHRPRRGRHPFFTRTGLDDLHKVVRRKKKKTVSHADAQEARRQAEIVMMGACDREALQAERHALATRVAELERQLAAFQGAGAAAQVTAPSSAQVTAPSSRAGSMDITAAS